ncbi:hypothetical protein [Cellulomonas phragmiteti]|uniref:Uncharacterized protein n=1 Tax=Cellulomonas phragmiteti TaxID=478780 RepID=A0ABQ4DH48_9CELL|nr:hypothetical protein [Cellulomonas phragmiteti]GIG38639.1 hypothetical protein Cph01nite_04010 [Cellulomonas phragmiteti]
MSIVDDAIAQDVRTYAAQVRAALADLGPEHVDDLTDGLEANLADALADDRRAHRGTLADEFGAPADYAAELRAAAGLAPGSGGQRTGGAVDRALRQLVGSVRDIEGTTLARLRATRWFPGVEDLLVALRPAWWVLRGWALAHLLLQMVGAEQGAFWLPSSSGGWVLLLLAVVASAQWGRGEWRTGPRWGRVLRFASGVLALAAAILLLTLPQAHRDDVARAQGWGDRPVEDGVVVAGERAFNLFVYDADGRPVEGAQVFDQAGRPVTTEPYGGDRWRQQEYWPDGAGDPLFHVGVPGPNGETRWNVFPLHSVPGWAWADSGAPLDVTDEDVRGEVLAPSWPFAAAAAVVPWRTGPEATLPAPAGASTPGATPSAEAVPPSDAPPATDGSAVPEPEPAVP